MKARHFFTLGLLVSAVLSCSLEPSPLSRTPGKPGTGNVQISFAPQGQARTITGTVFPAIGRYELTFQSATGSVTQSTSQTAVALQLAPGEWDLTVEAFDSATGGDLIAALSQTITVIEGPNTFNLLLLPLSNLSGNLSVQYDFDGDNIDEVVFAIRPWSLENPDSTDVSTTSINSIGSGLLASTDTLSAGTWTLVDGESARISATFNATLKSGTYLLQLTVNNQSSPLQMSQELVHIYDKTESQAHLNPIWVVSFDKNSPDATGVLDPMVIRQDRTVNLDPFAWGDLENSGYVFTGWNTQPDGSGAAYADNAPFTIGSADVTLYAQWAEAYILYFSPNGAAGKAPSSLNLAVGQTITLPPEGGQLSKSGYTFSGWNTVPEGTGTAYSDQGSFTMGTVDVTLYAQWTLIPTHKVIFFSNGGSGTLPDITVAEGGSIQLPAIVNTMTNTGYSFVGWDTSAGGGGAYYYDNTTLTMGTQDISLYAQWGRISFDQIGFTANGWAMAGDSGSGTDSFFQGGSLGFIGITAGGASGYLQTYDTGGTPAPGLSGSGISNQGEFRVSRFTASPAMTMDAVAIYNATGTSQTIDVRGWLLAPVWPAPTSGEVIYQPVTVVPGWNTVVLGGFVGLDTVTFDFTDYQTFYFNEFAIR